MHGAIPNLCVTCRFSQGQHGGGLFCRAFTIINVTRTACPGYQYEPGTH